MVCTGGGWGDISNAFRSTPYRKSSVYKVMFQWYQRTQRVHRIIINMLKGFNGNRFLHTHLNTDLLERNVETFQRGPEIPGIRRHWFITNGGETSPAAGPPKGNLGAFATNAGVGKMLITLN